MNTVSSLILYVIVFIIAIALLLCAVWLLNKIARNRYHDRAVNPMLLPGRASLSLADWGDISPPNSDGVLTCNGTAPLEGLPDQVELIVKSKDKSAIADLTENVKFQFSPIYEPLPVDIIQQLLSYLGIASDSNVEEVIVLDDHDWLLEFGMRAGGKESSNKYFAVAFNIDPTINRIHEINKCPQPIRCNCNRKNNYSSKAKVISEKISVSNGSVDASPGGTYKTGPSKNIPMGGRKNLSIGGRAQNNNTYSLTGTWNYR